MRYLYETLINGASWPSLVVLVVLLFVGMYGFGYRKKELDRLAGKEATTFDSQWRGYSPAEAGQWLDGMGTEGRPFYAKTQLSLDVIFPFVYTGIMAILLVWAYKQPGWLLLVPLVVLAADLSENFLTAYMAWTHKEGDQPAIAVLARIFTQTKWVGVLLGVVLAAGRGVYNLVGMR